MGHVSPWTSNFTLLARYPHAPARDAAHARHHCPVIVEPRRLNEGQIRITIVIQLDFSSNHTFKSPAIVELSCIYAHEKYGNSRF